MGDFEDCFGAGADSDSVIDGICAAEARYDREEELAKQIIEHLIWFPDYEAAERWEKYHKGTPFTRQKRQGGYEVTVVARRDAAWDLSRSEPSSGVHRDPEPTDLFYPEGLANREIVHGKYRVRLAKRTSQILSDLQRSVRACIAPGRAGLSPMCLSLKELRALCKSSDENICHEFEMGRGTIAIFSSEHLMIVGRRKGKEVQLWPWTLEINCIGGDPSKGGGCFICANHYEYQVGDGVTRGRSKFIYQDYYDGSAKPKDLARCILEWIESLAVFDARLGDRCQSPSSVNISSRDKREYQSQVDEWCRALACVIAIQKEVDVEVFYEFEEDPNTLSQTGPDRLKFKWRKATPLLSTMLDTGVHEVPDLKGLKKVPLPGWQDVIELRSAGETLRYVSHVGNNLGRQKFSIKECSAHKKLNALRFAAELLKSDLPPVVQEFLEAVDQDE